MSESFAEPGQEMRFRCSGGHRFSEVWPAPMTMMEFSRRMMAISKCPKCGAPTFLGWRDHMPNATEVGTWYEQN